MRVLVCGGRDYEDQAKVNFILDRLMWGYRGVLVHGAATGADLLAETWQRTAGYRQQVSAEAYPADWATYGKSAGPIRNQQMLDTGIDLVIAFPGGRGTEDMKTRARKAGVPVLEVT